MGVVSGDDIDSFIVLWKYYDPTARGWISSENLVYLLCELKHPLGRNKDDMKNMKGNEEELEKGEVTADRYLVQKEKKIVIKKIKGLEMLQDNLNIKMHGDKNKGYRIHYAELLRALIRRILNERKKEFEVKGEMKKKLKTQQSVG